MSFRSFASILFRQGKLLLRNQPRNLHSTNPIIDNISLLTKPVGQSSVVSDQALVKSLPKSFSLRNVGIQVGLHARRIFIDSVLNRVTNSLSTELRRKVTRRLFYGDSGTFFALVGVSLASGTGILTKDDEFEGVCKEIGKAMSKIEWNLDVYNNIQNVSEIENDNFSLEQLVIDEEKPIGKGCSGVIYSAKLKNNENCQSNDLNGSEKSSSQNDNNQNIVLTGTSSSQSMDHSVFQYPLALKIIFNYDVQSNSMAILRAMYQEIVPARKISKQFNDNNCERNFNFRKLPPHPNIVAIYNVFDDYFPNLKNSFELYPDALPPRLNSDGCGRNKTMFLLMKRYDTNLKDYLLKNKLETRTSVLILAQLLEGVCHLCLNGVAHRDLKSDNILLDLCDEVPSLVISDFGLCLADKKNGLKLPYNSSSIEIGGNTALMAPEIICQRPGPFTRLDYTKSDLWTVGTIAYEIFEESNPFYNNKLSNYKYTDSELPELNNNCPDLIKNLIKNILLRNPSKRLTPNEAANVLQLYLWAPSKWVRDPPLKMPSSNDILQWLLCLTTKMLCEGHFPMKVNSISGNDNLKNGGRRTYTEYLLISSFLKRVSLKEIRKTLNWIHDVIDE